jgi:hypothetical protein
VKRNLFIALSVSGSLWALSWVVICLEIFRWHHMTTGLRLNPPQPLPGFPPPRPGEFLISAIVLSIAAPATSILLLSWRLLAPKRNRVQSRDVL